METNLYNPFTISPISKAPRINYIVLFVDSLATNITLQTSQQTSHITILELIFHWENLRGVVKAWFISVKMLQNNFMLSVEFFNLIFAWSLIVIVILLKNFDENNNGHTIPDF